jgi:GT2 family glycosyltransferase
MYMKIAVVIPNWNGVNEIDACLSALTAQSMAHHVIVVENGSTDGSLEFIRAKYPNIDVIVNQKNLGFAGGVNVGIRKALGSGFDYVALLNNDAVPHKHWLKHLAKTLYIDSRAGIVTCKLLQADGKHVDSTGDFYTSWGLPYPRDRGAPTNVAHNKQEEVFGASGGASLYRAEMFGEIGLFDEDFFAYYEDVDISFRAQLAGWKVLYQPKSEAYHATSTTSGKIKGFGTYQYHKNVPLVLIKNVPGRLFFRVAWRFGIAYSSVFINSIVRGNGWAAIKGFLHMLTLLPKKLMERRSIQKNRKTSVDYIHSVIINDLPPNAKSLRRLRSIFNLQKKQINSDKLK